MATQKSQSTSRQRKSEKTQKGSGKDSAQSVITAPGVIRWPHINRPDEKFNRVRPYHTQLILKKEDGEELREVIEELVQKKWGDGPKANKAHRPLEYDAEKEVYILRASTKYKPAIIKPNGEAYGEDEKVPLIGRGAIASLSVSFVTYLNGGNHGVTAYLRGVQLIKNTIEQHGGDGEGSWYQDYSDYDTSDYEDLVDEEAPEEDETDNEPDEEFDEEQEVATRGRKTKAKRKSNDDLDRDF